MRTYCRTIGNISLTKRALPLITTRRRYSFRIVPRRTTYRIIKDLLLIIKISPTRALKRRLITRVLPWESLIMSRMRSAFILIMDVRKFRNTLTLAPLKRSRAIA